MNKRKKLLTALLTGAMALTFMGSVDATGVAPRVVTPGIVDGTTHNLQVVTGGIRARATRTQAGGVNIIVRAILFRNNVSVREGVNQGNTQVTAISPIYTRLDGNFRSGAAHR